MSAVDVEIGQLWADEEGLKWKVRAFSRRGWPVVSRFGYRTAPGIETNPGWFERWTLLTQPTDKAGGEG